MTIETASPLRGDAAGSGNCTSCVEYIPGNSPEHRLAQPDFLPLGSQSRADSRPAGRMRDPRSWLRAELSSRRAGGDDEAAISQFQNFHFAARTAAACVRDLRGLGEAAP
jgi:hypothetical protein